jgi:hypothetical protein
MIGIETATIAIKCPECGRPIGYGRSKFLFVQFEWWKAIPAKSCEYAGRSLTVTLRQITTREIVRFGIGWSLVAVGTLLMSSALPDLPCIAECAVLKRHLTVATAGFADVAGALVIMVGVALIPWSRIIRPFG